MTASSTPSEIWSAILSGCPSVTDSEVNRYSVSPCVMKRSFRTRAGDLDEVGDHHVLVAQLDVVRVRACLDALDLLAALRLEVVESDEAVVDDARGEARALEVLDRLARADDRQLC